MSRLSEISIGFYSIKKKIKILSIKKNFFFTERNERKVFSYLKSINSTLLYNLFIKF